MTEYIQHVLDEGNEGKNKISLEKFAKIAIDYMKEHTTFNEVVKTANDIIDFERNTVTPPRILHPLPDGYEYRFSGYFGQVIGICKKQ